MSSVTGSKELHHLLFKYGMLNLDTHGGYILMLNIFDMMHQQ